MKSRRTTYLLLTAVVAVWSVVGWRIFAPIADEPEAVVPRPAEIVSPAAADTLLLDYPDPFLKGTVVNGPRSPRPSVRALPPPPARREKVRIAHLATIESGGQPLHILTIGNGQHELAHGDEAEGFKLSECDRDSVYLRKNGITYGVKRCE